MNSRAVQKTLRRLGGWAADRFGISVVRTDALQVRDAERARLLRTLTKERGKVRALKERLGAAGLRLDELQAALAQRDRDVVRAILEQDEIRRQAGDLFVERKRLARRLAHAETQRDEARKEAFQLSKELSRRTEDGSIVAMEGETWALPLARARQRVLGRASQLDQTAGSNAPVEDGLLATKWPPLNPRFGAEGSWSPLRVCLVGESRSHFLSFKDPGILVRHFGDPIVRKPDILVFTRAELEDYQSRAEAIPAEIWEGAREGRTTIVFDGSNEGYPHQVERSRALHDLLAQRSVSPSTVRYLTQDRQYRADYEAWCGDVKVAPMRVLVFDAFIYKTLQTFLRQGDLVFERRLAEFLNRPAQRSRQFLSLNLAPRPTKVLLLLRLMRDGLWEKGWISFGGFSPDAERRPQSRPLVINRLLGLDGFIDDLDSALPHMERLAALQPVLFTKDGERAGSLARKLTLSADELPQYGDSWFSIVTETEMNTRRHRITEKPLKALLNFHPFLLLGNPGSLALLHGYGFETFHPVLDERYDSEPNLRRRFDMVYAEVRRLCAMEQSELARMTERCAEILAFNACWALTELPRQVEKLMVAGLINQLTPEAGGGASSRTVANL